MRRIVGTLLLCLTAGPLVAAADLVTLATLAAQGPLEALEKAYQRPGSAIKVDLDTSPNITKRIAAGEAPDVLIAQTSLVDQVIKDGRGIASTRVPLGKIGVGVAMGRGALRPDVATVDGLKASILQADAIVYSKGASGLLVEQVLAKMGLADRISGKIVQLATGSDVMKRLGAASGNEIGFTMVSEIKLGESYGGSFVGPLPAPVQTYTGYDAVVMSRSGASEEARAFIRAITTPAARQVFAAAGWEF